MKYKHPIIRVNNANICNFSSPYPIRFDTNDILPECDAQTAQQLAVLATQVDSQHPTLPGVTDTGWNWKIHDGILTALCELQENENIDIILVPPELITALKQYYNLARLTDMKIRTVVNKQANLASSTVFGIH